MAKQTYEIAKLRDMYGKRSNQYNKIKENYFWKYKNNVKLPMMD